MYNVHCTGTHLLFQFFQTTQHQISTMQCIHWQFCPRQHTISILSLTAHNLYFVQTAHNLYSVPDSTQSLLGPRQHTISTRSQTAHNLYSFPESQFPPCPRHKKANIHSFPNSVKLISTLSRTAESICTVSLTEHSQFHTVSDRT